jgi:hypothetical protein
MMIPDRVGLCCSSVRHSVLAGMVDNRVEHYSPGAMLMLLSLDWAESTRGCRRKVNRAQKNVDNNRMMLEIVTSCWSGTARFGVR